MVKTVLLENQELMVTLDSQEFQDDKVKRVVEQLSRIVPVAHHPVPPKASKVPPVHHAIVANLVDLALQVLLVNLVDAFLVTVENLEMMVHQVMMDSMANLVNQVSPGELEIMLALKDLPVQISSLT